MNYAVLKSDCMEVCQYDGFEELETYPKWMHLAVIDKQVESLFDADSGLVDIDPQPDDYFILNKKAEVKQVSYDIFKENMLLVDGDDVLGCIKAQANECVIFDGQGYGDWESYPKWMRALIEDDTYYFEDQLIIWDQPLCPGDVFIRNKEGNIRWIDEDQFNDNYYLATEVS